jgi:hypothetical protein
MTTPIITDAMIEQARALQARTFDELATITRLVWIDDGAGGQYPGTPVTISVPCRLSGHVSAAGEQVVGGALVGGSLWDITFPALTEILLSDRIEIDGTMYEVVNAYAPKSRETARVILAVKR